MIKIETSQNGYTTLETPVGGNLLFVIDLI